ncbi:MAG TPA: Rid family hydrolase [Caulobacteraceae bacterium]|jgi:2-iminobutanoate/2-iminopropanoate deaminase|nr:Rid family hydrolase [Caulobacteraceae bacterium]
MSPALKTLAAAALIAALPLAACAVEVTHFPAGAPAGLGPMPVGPPYSAAVMAGDTLYVAGTTDADPATGRPAADATAAAKVVLDRIRGTVEKAGLTMDDLVWVQVFTSDVRDFGAFNAVYRSYFHGPMPARAFIGAGSLLGGAHFEVMGIAVRRK